MNNRSVFYHKTYPLRLNVLLLFYVYVFIVLIIANLLPVSVLTYFLFLLFGIIGICILLVRYEYHILIKENTIFISIKIPLKISLLKLKIIEIKTIEEIDTGSIIDDRYRLKKLKGYYTSYLFDKGAGLRLTMKNGKIFIISCPDAGNIITRINALKDKTG
jgi:hypothetical protein